MGVQGIYDTKKKEMRYGVPYQGSKNKIAAALADAIPHAGFDNFYDLFAGGCAMTHVMLERGWYKRYFANDLDGFGLRLFTDAIAGKFRNERRWISREEFHANKSTDPYISLVWSFGNNMRNYLYSAEIEPWKRALHYARVCGDCSLMDAFGIHTDGSSADIRVHHTEYKRNYIDWYLHVCGGADTVRLQGLEGLQRLQGLQGLERLQGLQRLETSFKSYDDVEILPNSIVYCDPPYRGTRGYARVGKFDHDRFYRWCERQEALVLISEYAMPSDRFVCVFARNRQMTFQAGINRNSVERLFVPRRQAKRYYELMGKPRWVQLELFDKKEYYV